MFKGLGGLGNLGDMAKMMKAAQEMQGRVVEMQEAMGAITVEGSAGGGLVRATATAKGELKALRIDPSIFREEDQEMVEDLIVAAVKDAQAKAAERMNEEMRRMAAEIGLPPGMSPF